MVFVFIWKLLKKNKKTDIKYIMKLLKIGAHMKNNIIEFQSKEMEEKKKINKKKL